MKQIIRKPFYFVRHGETDWNLKNMCQGHLDIPLNENGRRQACLTGQTLKSLAPSIIASSPLHRARETADIIKEILNHVHVIEIDQLKERFWGDVQGDKREIMYQIEEEESANPNISHTVNAENHEDFANRIASGINDILKLYDTPLFVSHGRVFRTLCIILGLPPKKQLVNGIVAYCQPTSDGGWQISLRSFKSSQTDQ